MLGIRSGPLDFVPAPSGPAGSPYQGDFEVEVVLEGGQLMLRKLQKPSQTTSGPMDPNNLAYWTFGGEGFFEAYVGQACPGADGGVWLFGFTLGGSPDLEDRIVDVVNDISLMRLDADSPGSLLRDPALVDPGPIDCDLDQNAALARAQGLLSPDGDPGEHGLDWFSLFAGRVE